MGARYLKNWRYSSSILYNVYVRIATTECALIVTVIHTLEMMYWNHFAIISTIDLNNFVTLFSILLPLRSLCFVHWNWTVQRKKHRSYVLWSVRPCIYDHSRLYAFCIICHTISWQQKFQFHSKLYKHNIAYFDTKSRSSTWWMR